MRPSRSTRSRSRLSRRTLLSSCVAVGALSAGCTDFLGDGGDDPPEDPADVAPRSASALARLEAGSLEGNEADRLLAEAAGTGGDVDVETRIDAVAERTGLDPLETETTVLLDVQGATEGDVSLANAVLETGRDADDVVESLEETTGATYERTSHAGEDVLYEPDDDAEPVLGSHGDGRFVVGDAAAVTGSLDVRYGDAEAVAGPIRDAYDDARTAPLCIASAPSEPVVPEEYRNLAPGVDFGAFEEIEAVGRRYEPTADGVALEVAMYVGSEEDARDLGTVVEGAVAFLASQDDDLESDDADVERDGTVVRVGYEGDLGPVVSLLEEL